eukprot:5098035-Amphidinium_carterae.1
MVVTCTRDSKSHPAGGLDVEVAHLQLLVCALHGKGSCQLSALTVLFSVAQRSRDKRGMMAQELARAAEWSCQTEAPTSLAKLLYSKM